MSNQIQDISGVVVPSDTGMTQEAIARDKSLGVGLFKIASIYADPIFNCRGPITPASVVPLARDIAQNGLLQPVVITPRRSDTPANFEYSLVAGHRRHKSYVVNNYPLIPAVLRTDLDEFSARTLNLKENLNRMELNILQEANALKPYQEAGWTRNRISEELQVTPTWVQVRLQLLTMPVEIQEAAASGLFTQAQIRDLYSIKVPEKQLLMARKIKESKERHESPHKIEEQLREIHRPNQKRTRKRAELFMLQSEIREVCGNNIITRVLGWAAGEVDDLEMYTELRDYCATLGIEYKVPDFTPEAS